MAWVAAGLLALGGLIYLLSKDDDKSICPYCKSPIKKYTTRCPKCATNLRSYNDDYTKKSIHLKIINLESHSREIYVLYIV